MNALFRQEEQRLMTLAKHRGFDGALFAIETYEDSELRWNIQKSLCHADVNAKDA